MSNTRRTVAKNAGFLMLSQIITWSLTMVLTLFLPRMLGAEAVGQLHLAESIWAIVGIFLSFGMDTYITKEVSRIPEKTGELLGLSLVLRTVLFVFGFIAVVIYANFIGYEWLTILVILIYGGGKLILEFGAATNAVLSGLERMEYMALAAIVTRIVTTIVVITLLLLGYGVVAASIVFAAASLIGLFIQLFFLRRLQPIRFSFSLETGRKMLKASLPYMFVMLFSVTYMNLDAIIISILVDEETLGWYSGADRLFGTLMFVPVVFITAVFPTLSRLNTESPEELRKLMRRSFDMLLVFGVPIGLGIFSISDNLVVLLFGEAFAPSGPVLAILGLVLIFTYQNILLGRFLIAVDRQNIWTVVMAVATIATIPLDLFFIPIMHRTFGNGAMGGAIAFIVTELFMTLVGLHFLPSGSLTKANLWVAARVLLAGLVMVAVVWPMRHLFIALPVISGGVTYMTLILLFRVISNEDKALLKNQASGLWRRLPIRRTQPAGAEIK